MLLLFRDYPDRLALLTLPILVGLVYAIVFPGHFFMDDAPIVLGNHLVYAPDMGTIFTSDYWGAGENTGLYRPLTILSFTLNYQLLGEQAWSYLLVNLLLHTAVAVLLYLYLRRLELPRLAAWLAAALFAVHPLHGEAVIQLVGRSELLVALFVLFALLTARTAGRRKNVVIVLCYIGAILSKEHGIVLLALIPVVDLFCDRLRFSELWRRRGALLTTLVTITAAWLLYRHFVVHGGIPAPVSLDPYYLPLATVDTPTRILSALKLQMLYLAKLVVPYHLQGMYPQSMVVPFASWFSLWGLAVVSCVAALVAVCIAGWKSHALWALMIVLYAISFAPTANIFFFAGFTMAERVAYLPSLWFCAGIASALATIPRLAQERRFAWGAVGTLLTLYALTGMLRFYDFRTLERYWLHDLRINPHNELSLLMLADHYRGVERLVDAEVRGRELITVAPEFKEGLSGYARTLLELNRPLEAITIAQRAISLEKPGAVSSAKLPLAGAQLKLGRIDEALKTLQDVRITDRNQPAYWELYGKALEAQGDLVGALSCYQKEAASSGGRAKDGLRRLGMVLAKLGRPAEAEELLRRDVRINPQAGDGWNALGVVLAMLGKKEEASQSFAKAVELKPESVEYRANLKRSQGG